VRDHARTLYTWSCWNPASDRHHQRTPVKCSNSRYAKKGSLLGLSRSPKARLITLPDYCILLVHNQRTQVFWNHCWWLCECGSCRDMQAPFSRYNDASLQWRAPSVLASSHPKGRHFLSLLLAYNRCNHAMMRCSSLSPAYRCPRAV
jgi:hypothetical protein